MRTFSRFIFVMALVAGVGGYAAEPTTIEELKAHFTSVSDGKDTFTAEYSMEMDMAAAGPAAAGMGDMGMGGDLIVRGDAMRMTMSMSMGEGDQAMKMDMDMVMGEDKVMHMVMQMPGMTQAMKMDMSVMEELADTMGIPASALNSGNMGGGMMTNPTKILESMGEMYDLTLGGKETLDGVEVYVVEASIKAETLENLKKNPMLQGQTEMFDMGQKVYLGAEDGVMRKTVTGDFMSMTLSNIDFDATIEDSDFVVELPEGVQEIDMTEMMKGMFANMAVGGADADAEGE